MRILCVHNQFQKYGGADAVAAADGKLLAEHGDVVTYTRQSNEIVSASQLQKFGMGVDALYSRRTVREITDIVGRFRPDIAYVHNVFPLISPSLYDVLYRLRVPSVHIIHDYRLLCPNSRFYVNDEICERCKLGNFWSAVAKRCVRGNIAESALYASSVYLNRKLGLMDKIGGYICLTEFTKGLLLEAKIPENKLYVCPNHIDTSAVTPQFGGSVTFCTWAGCIVIRVCSPLRRHLHNSPTFPLKIVGTGDDEGELLDFIASHQLSNVEMIGFKAGQEKLEYLRNSMFTLVPSHYYENFPVVVLEAFASGKPVIASAQGALQSIIQPQQTGLLFKSEDADDLAAKVRWLHDRPDQIENMGRTARNLVESKYDSRLRYPSLETIFEDVIKTARVH